MFGKAKGEGQNIILDLARAEVKIEIYEAQIAELTAQVTRLQEALVAASAPKAYDQMLYDRKEPEVFDPEREQRRQEDRALKEWLEQVEGPTFKDADDLVSTLGSLIGVNAGSESLNNDTES